MSEHDWLHSPPFICAVCHGPLQTAPDAWACAVCGRTYPIMDGFQSCRRTTPSPITMTATIGAPTATTTVLEAADTSTHRPSTSTGPWLTSSRSRARMGHHVITDSCSMKDCDDDGADVAPPRRVIRADGLRWVRDGRRISGQGGRLRGCQRHQPRGCSTDARARSTLSLDITPIVADIEHLPFTDRSFDVVLVHDGLHHLEQPRTGLTEMARVASHWVSVT